MITALLAAMVFSAVQDPAPLPPQDGDGEGGRRPRRVEFGGGGFQQQDPEKQAEQRAKWLKDQLGLTDEQVQKATDVYKQTREAELKIDTERQAKLREILTDDQKKKYDEILANMNRPRTPLSGLESMMDGWADTLKRELSLDDSALGKIKPIIDDFRKRIQERAEKLRQEGFQNLNWQEEMQKFRDGVKEAGDKVKEHLTPEQKEKFDKLSERFQHQAGRGGFGGERRAPTPEERATRAVELLKISDSAEQAAVKAAIQKVFEAQAAMSEGDRDLRGKIDELHKDGSLSDEQVTTKLNELRTARLEKDKAVKAAQSALREIVSPRQELELIRQGALR